MTKLLNENFWISNVFTNLDINGGTLEINFTVNQELSEYLAITKNSKGEWEGKFLKGGWPKQLPVLVSAIVYPSGITDPNDIGVKHRFMIGYIPSDRYYDPKEDPDFIPQTEVMEGDINALTAEYFSILNEKKGWRVTGIYVALLEYLVLRYKLIPHPLEL